MTDELLVQSGLAEEDAPSLNSMLDDLASETEGVGSWPRGWYRATVLAGYKTGKGTMFETKDAASLKQTSRNVFICLAVAGDVFVPASKTAEDRKLTQGPGGARNIRATYNYHPEDMTPVRLVRIKSARKQNKSVQGAWPDKAMQSSSLSIGRIGQLQKALGSILPFANGRFNPSVFVDQKIDVRLDTDEKGFNEVTAVAPAGTKVK